MCRTNGLKNIYESELNRKSKYYAVFDALLRHFRYAEAAACQEVGAVGSQEMGKLIFGDEKLNRQYSADMIPFLRSGAIHLGYLLGEQKHKATIIKVYDKIVRGLTVREIVARLSVSQHTIQQCRMIAVNELACSYELAHRKARKY